MKKSEYTKALRDCNGDEDELKLVMAIQTIEEAGLSVSESEADEPKTSDDTLKSVSKLINRG